MKVSVSWRKRWISSSGCFSHMIRVVLLSCKENGAQKMLLKLFFQIYGKENTDERTGRFMKKPKHKRSEKDQGWSALFEVIKEIIRRENNTLNKGNQLSQTKQKKYWQSWASVMGSKSVFISINWYLFQPTWSWAHALRHWRTIWSWPFPSVSSVLISLLTSSLNINQWSTSLNFCSVV